MRSDQRDEAFRRGGDEINIGVFIVFHFLMSHPGWLSRWFIMDDVRSGRYNGGFAMAKKLTPEEYTSAPMDPVAPFSAPVCSHMNGDHMDDMKASGC